MHLLLKKEVTNRKSLNQIRYAKLNIPEAIYFLLVLKGGASVCLQVAKGRSIDEITYAKLNIPMGLYF